MKVKNADVFSTLVAIVYIHIGATVTQEDPQSASFVNCSFEDGMCDWESISASWKIGEGSPTTSGTGSAHDHTLRNASGIYIYIDPKSVNTSQSQVIESPLLPWNDSCLSLWYHICGNDTGNLTVSIEIKNTTTATKFRTTQSGNKTILWNEEGKFYDKWHRVEITIQTQEAFRVLVVETTKRQNGAIAVDDIQLSKCCYKDNCGFGFCNWIQKTSVATYGAASFSRTTGQQSGRTNKTTDPKSGRTNKSTDPQSGRTNKKTDPKSGRTKKTKMTRREALQTRQLTRQVAVQTKQTDPPSGLTKKTTDPPSGRTNKTTDPPSGSTNRTTDLPSGRKNKTTDPQSGVTNKTAESPSGVTNKTDEMAACAAGDHWVVPLTATRSSFFFYLRGIYRLEIRVQVCIIIGSLAGTMTLVAVVLFASVCIYRTKRYSKKRNTLNASLQISSYDTLQQGIHIGDYVNVVYSPSHSITESPSILFAHKKTSNNDNEYDYVS